METAVLAEPFEIKRSLGFLVLRSQRLMRQQLEGLFLDLGLTLSQFVSLQLIYEAQATLPCDIARTLGFDTGTATRIVDQLEDKGLVFRKRDAPDRRLVTITLTEAGRQTAEAGQAASTTFESLLLDELGAEDVARFLEQLGHLVRRLEERANAIPYRGPP